jgi:hypothetical protein
MALYAIVHETFEAAVGDAYPVVTHIFRGRTEDEAWRYFRAHLTTDSFFKSCEERGRWQRVRCTTRTRVVRER